MSILKIKGAGNEPDFQLAVYKQTLSGYQMVFERMNDPAASGRGSDKDFYLKAVASVTLDSVFTCDGLAGEKHGTT